MTRRLDEKARRVSTLANALDDEDPDVLAFNADMLASIIQSQGLSAQDLFTRLAPTLRQYGVRTPPSMHTWRAVSKELNRRAVEKLPERRGKVPGDPRSVHPSRRTRAR